MMACISFKDKYLSFLAFQFAKDLILFILSVWNA